jgi:hypothetical protein
MHQIVRRPVRQGRALAAALLLMAALTTLSTILTPAGDQVQPTPHVTVDLSRSVSG